MSLKMMDNFYNKDYYFFVSKNSSELTAIMLQDIGLFMRCFSAILNLLIEKILLIFILTYLLFMNFQVGFIFILSMGIYFMMYFLFTKKKLLELGQQRNILYEGILKDLNESFGNFREIIVYNCKKIFLDNISKKYKAFFSNLLKFNIYQQTSKVLIEQVFIITIISIFSFLIFFKSNANLNLFVPLLAVYLFAFLRILPSFNKIIMEFQSYISHKLFVTKVNEQFTLFKNKNNYANGVLDFKNNIEFKNITFNFNNFSTNVFDQLNIKIEKNSKIGIIGKSGSGKTTFLNLLMGFLNPSTGIILVDGKNIQNSLETWRKKIAFVSQSTYLLDDTITRNITFQKDKSKIDMNLLNQSILMSGLKSFISNLPHGLDTTLGERGSKISGGEILRIALARAFYSNKEIYILDEFTSALDNETEMEILQNLKKFHKTIIIVSHKNSTLINCDIVYEISKNGFHIKE